MNNTPTLIPSDTPIIARHVVMADEGPYFGTPDGYQMQKLWNRYPTPAAEQAAQAYLHPKRTALKRILAAWFQKFCYKLGYVRISGASSPVLHGKSWWYRIGNL